MPLTPEEEIAKTIAAFDIPQIYADYVVLERRTMKRRLQRLFSKKIKAFDEQIVHQLEFLNTVHELLKFEQVEDQAYALLGALGVAETNWGQFPDHGPLMELAFKRDDLIQVLGEFGKDIELTELFKKPDLIQKRALEAFKAFQKKHPTVADFLQ